MAFGYNLDQARALLQSMARTGEGTFRDANLASPDDTFLQFDFRSLDSPQTLSGLMALNQHARVTATGPAPDTDTDGLADSVELEAGTDPENVDSDRPMGDGYTDLLEHRLAGSGFDALDPSIPAISCGASSDLDGDGLLDCEEDFLETDPRHPDTDGDQLTDWIELMMGTDPLVDDALADLDFDGVLNGDEILGATDPTNPDPERYRNDRIRYGLSDLGIREVTSFETGDTDLRHCYEFNVRNIELVVTPLIRERGLNRILIYASEEPAQLGGARSITSVACFEAFYLGESVKNPESGVIDATEAGWTAMLGGVQREIDSLLSCNWFDAADFTRPRIVRAINECLPDAIQLGRFEYPEDELMDLVRQYVATNTAVNLPQPASEIFVPIEIFDPGAHCYRPWELDRLSALFEVVRQTCEACATWDGTDPIPSPCCMP
jgi:hypothetical protein